MSSEDALNKRLDDEFAHLIDNLGWILKAAPIKQKTVDKHGLDRTETKPRSKLSQEHLLVDAASANIIRSVETLLSLTLELKQSLLMNDFKTLNSTLRSRLGELHTRQSASIAGLLELQTELDEVAVEMEEALYSSAYYNVPSLKRDTLF